MIWLIIQFISIHNLIKFTSDFKISYVNLLIRIKNPAKEPSWLMHSINGCIVHSEKDGWEIVCFHIQLYEA